MSTEIAYFLKINVAIALFYAFYRLFFHKDTFFLWRRITLICFFIVSLLYPLMNMQGWIRSQEPMVAMVDLYTTVLPELVIQPTQTSDIHWQTLLIQAIQVAYWCGVALLALRFLIQLGSIIRLHFSSPKGCLQGTRVHYLNKEIGPFSFFHWIFIHPSSHTESEIREIITHETTHAQQYHSADVIISEIMCICCWFNPFIWLMKREVRSNLEYMADYHVLKAGHDSKSYQYNLLGLAHHKAAANLSNSFNVLPLKNRIKMMNKRRTQKVGKTKYLMFIPLAILLMIVSNIEVVARSTGEWAKELIEQTDVQVLTPPEIINSSNELTPPEIILQDKKSTPKIVFVPPKIVYDDPVYAAVEEMPTFPGGIEAMMEYLKENIRYPAEAHKKATQGRVIAQFVVKKDGSISGAKIIRGVDPLLDKEALRVINSMPNWTPGKQNGKAVNVQFTIPIGFSLDKQESAAPKAIEEPDVSEIVVVGYGADKATTDNKVYERVDQMPQFPGGTEGLMKYLSQNIKYPTIAQKNKEEGRVIVKMVVGADGNLSNIEIVRGVSPLLDAEAVRVVSGMPKWVPGQMQGKPVPVKYTIPVHFRLQKPAN